MIIGISYEYTMSQQWLIDTLVEQGRNPWPMCEMGFRLTTEGGCVFQDLFIFDRPKPPMVVDLEIPCSPDLVVSPSVCSFEIPPPYYPPIDPPIDPPTPVSLPGSGGLFAVGLVAFVISRRCKLEMPS